MKWAILGNILHSHLVQPDCDQHRGNGSKWLFWGNDHQVDQDPPIRAGFDWLSWCADRERNVPGGFLSRGFLCWGEVGFGCYYDVHEETILSVSLQWTRELHLEVCTAMLRRSVCVFRYRVCNWLLSQSNMESTKGRPCFGWKERL